MDTELLVENRIEDGRDLIARLVNDGFDVTVAFWVRTSEDSLLFLYIGSASVQADKLAEAYRRVYTCLTRIANVRISLSEIKLVPANNPIAQDALAVRNKYPARIPTRYRGKRLGGLSIDEAYIYPPITGHMTSNDVLQTVLGLMKRTGPLQPSTVTLSDGTKIRAIPAGIDMKAPGTIQVVLHDVASGAIRAVAVDEVTNIQ